LRAWHRIGRRRHLRKSQFTDFEALVKTPWREKGNSITFAKQAFDVRSGTEVAAVSVGQLSKAAVFVGDFELNPLVSDFQRWFGSPV
jgi:hypothetical protein